MILFFSSMCKMAIWLTRAILPARLTYYLENDPHFDVLRDLLLKRRTATWNLFVLYNKETKLKRFYLKIFLNYSKAAWPTVANTKKAI